MPGVAVTFAVTAGGGSVSPSTPILTDAGGIAQVTSWTLGTTAGANALGATSGGLTGSPQTFSATGTAAAASAIAKNGGDAQTATVASAVATAPSVKVTDQFGNAVSGVAVTFAVTAGGGSVTGGNQVTNAGGIATVGSWTLGSSAGANGMSATATGLTGSPLGFTATGTAAAAANIARNAGNAQTDTIGAKLPVALSVLVTDNFGNAVSGATVNWAGTGGATVSPASSITNAAGIATDTLTLGSATGAQGATATSGGLTGSPVSFTATATHGIATQIAINGGNGQTTTAGTAVAIAPSAIVKDRAGNAVNGVNVTFAVTGGGGTVNPTTPIATNGSGVAQVTSWTLGSTAGPNTLSATAAGLSGSPLSFSATGTAGCGCR